MPEFTPQQREAITVIDRNVAVSAGAGSGKTRVLVERFLHILRRGLINEKENIAAGEILAITFTRKAAAEMKSRIRASMEDLRRGDALHGFFWQQQLNELERAPITTIHGFCNRVLKENPVEAGLDPAFTLAEEFEGEEFIRSCLQNFFRQELRADEEYLRSLLEIYGVAGVMSQLKELLPQLDDILSFGDVGEPYRRSAAKAAADKAALNALLRSLAERRDEVKSKAQTAKLALLAENLDAVTSGVASGDFGAYNVYMQPITATGTLKDLIADIKEEKNKLELTCADEYAAQTAENWLELLTRFGVYLEQQKRSGDFLTFDDLEALALKLLESSAALRAKYQAKYRYIMVDEFQDTNERQRRLVYLLCGGDAEKLQGGKLFIVGDPKQSIYRFRGADVSVFARVRRDIEAAGGKNITLADNFRTVDTVLNACNDAFISLLGEDKKQNVYFEALQAHRVSEEKTVLLRIAVDADVKDKRRAEADALAAQMRKLHAAGINYGSMTLLLSAMTYCETFVTAMQVAGVPCMVVDGKGFYEKQEIIDLQNLLTALHNKFSDLELTGILRSPYFGVDDESLTWLFLNGAADTGCLWDAVQNADLAELKAGQQELLLRAARLLERMRQAASLLTLPELLEYILRLLNAAAVLNLQENGAAKYANVEKLLELARQFTAEKNGSLGGWLEYVARLREENVRETAANVEAQDAVTIMTIHKSKGLEFGTVFLPMLDARANTDRAEIKFNPQIGLGIKTLLPDGSLAETSVLRQAKEEDKLLQKAERQRQLYVAMTRAKDRLIMSGVSVKGKGESKSDNWFNALQHIFSSGDSVEIVELDAANLLLPQTQQPPAAVGAVDEQTLRSIEPLPEYGRGGQKIFNASALQTYLRCPRRYFYQKAQQLPPLETAATEGAEELPARVIGSVVHKALELYDGDARQAFTTAVIEEAAGNFQGAARAKRLLENYLASDLYRTQQPVLLREVKFVLPGGDNLFLNGVIDCVTTCGDAVKIIDYKTGAPPGAEELPLGYAYQLAIYKQAAQRLLRREVAAAELHFLQDLSARSLSGAELDALYGEALQLCKTINDAGEEADFACNLADCAVCPYSYLCPQK